MDENERLETHEKERRDFLSCLGSAIATDVSAIAASKSAERRNNLALMFRPSVPENEIARPAAEIPCQNDVDRECQTFDDAHFDQQPPCVVRCDYDRIETGRVPSALRPKPIRILDGSNCPEHSIDNHRDNHPEG